MPQLPALGFNPRNALIDFSPLTNALQSIQDQSNKDRAYELQRRESERQDAELALRRQQVGQSIKSGNLDYNTKLAQRSAGLAQLALNEKDQARKAAIMSRVYAMDSGYRDSLVKHGVNPDDYDGTAQFLIAEARGYQDPSIAETRALENEKTRAEIGALNRKAEPDPIDVLIMRKLSGSGAVPAPAAAPSTPQPSPPTVQPQSFEGAAPIPGVQLIADQQPQNAPSVQQQDMVETPYGRMPRDEAQNLAGSMLLSPKYSAAGRAILDSISKGSDVGMSKPAANQLDERTISAASTLGRLQEIRRQFKPDFLEIPSKMKLLGASWGAAFGGKLDPKMEQQLRDYAAFRATGFDNFNQLLKELSGTAVSAQELARQKVVQPNPGEGLFDGDDPVTFMSKIDQGERIAKAAMARMNYMRTKGLLFDKNTAESFMRLEDVPAAIDRRGAEIEQQLRQQNPKADPMAIEKETQRRLKQEFGI